MINKFSKILLTENQNKLQGAVLVFLVALSIFLGILIYKKNHVETVSSPSTEVNVGKIDTKVFSPDEVKMLNAPGPNATKEEIDSHSKLAAKLAVIGDTIEMEGCKAGPLVLQARLGSTITMHNKSKYNLSISFDGNNMYDIGAGKSYDISKAFVHGPGIYGYLCKSQDFTGLVGFVLISS